MHVCRPGNYSAPILFELCFQAVMIVHAKKVDEPLNEKKRPSSCTLIQCIGSQRLIPFKNYVVINLMQKHFAHLEFTPFSAECVLRGGVFCCSCTCNFGFFSGCWSDLNYDIAYGICCFLNVIIEPLQSNATQRIGRSCGTYGYGASFLVEEYLNLTTRDYVSGGLCE